MIGVTVQNPSDGATPVVGPTVAEVLARTGGTPTVYTTVDQVQGAGINVTQGNEKLPAWQGDATTGRLAPEVPGGLHYEKVLLVSTGQPLPLSQTQQDRE